jgi:hypothetical protein
MKELDRNLYSVQTTDYKGESEKREECNWDGVAATKGNGSGRVMNCS